MEFPDTSTIQFMNNYLIDTNTIIAFLHGNIDVDKRIANVGIKHCYVSEITLCELYFGAYNIKDRYQQEREKEFKRIELLQKKFPILGFKSSAELFGNIKAQLVKTGLIIDEFDILIGSSAITNGMIVVTDNVSHFSRIPGLKYENWLTR